MTTRYVYDFSEGDKDQKDLLGGKGANLAEMVNMGLPVPPGFTISTEACKAYLKNGSVPPTLRGEGTMALRRTEDEIGITKRLILALEAFPRTGPFVFDHKGGHYQEHNIAAWMRTLVKRAGVSWHGTHILRKTCGTRIADGGGGVAAVATHLRHKNLQTASRYIDRRGATSRALNALER